MIGGGELGKVGSELGGCETCIILQEAGSLKREAICRLSSGLVGGFHCTLQNVSFV